MGISDRSGVRKARGEAGTLMIEHDNLEEFRDPQIYVLREEGDDDDWQRTEQWARQKAAKQAGSIDWVVADARTFHLQRQFPFIYMLENVFQFFLTREAQEAMLARVREHLQLEGCFLFETRNPSPRNLLEVRRPEPQKYTTPDGGQLVITEQQHYDPMTQIQHYTRHF